MMIRVLLLVFLAVFLGQVPADDEYRPKIAEKSKDAELATQTFVLPENMSAKLLASEPELANPVAFYVTNDGRVLVCETFRQDKQVLDNRSYMQWLLNDLRLETVEEREAMFRQYLGDKVDSFGDDHDRVRLLQDTDGDGVFESDQVFAGGFNGVLDGTGAGVIEHNGSVYYACIPKLWKLDDTNGDNIADKQEALHHGYGVRVAFRGHDMHGLVVGPDGRLYFSIGDRGFNVINKEGERLKHVDTGAVFRCDLDGSNLEIFAYGLRNPQELAFDDFGNLWTGDNNSDGGDEARWVYIVQDGDTGWRMYFQYLEDRGPWNREHMWYPYRKDEKTTNVQPAYIVPPIANVGDGPSGLTYYPGLGLSERYRNHFFMADFRGGSANSGIRSFSVQPKGATFELTDSHQFIWSILGTDVDFAPDGSLYVSDWVNGWVGEGKGRLYRFTDDQNIAKVKNANVPNLLNGGIKNANMSTLYDLIDHDDRRVRQIAQFRLADQETTEKLVAAADSNQYSERARRHIAWALWQQGLQSEITATIVAQAALTKQDSASAEWYTNIVSDLVRRHGLDFLQKHRTAFRKLLRQHLSSDNLRLAGFAAAALGQVGREQDVSDICKLLDRNNNQDPVLRHQAVMGMVGIGQRSPGFMNQIDVKQQSSPVKLGFVLAMRRLERDDYVQLLEDDDAVVVAEVARTIHERGTQAAMNQLVFPLVLGTSHPRAITDPVVVRRALEAAYRLGEARHALAVARVAGDSTRPIELRQVALDLLKTWNNPTQTDSVDGRYRPILKREIQGLQDAVTQDLPGMLAGPKAVRDAAVELAAQLKITNVIPTLKQIFSDKTSDNKTRIAAFKALTELGESSSSFIDAALEDSAEVIRIAALEYIADTNPDKAVVGLKKAANQGSLVARQQAIRLLGQIKSPAALDSLQSLMSKLKSNTLPAGVMLDLLDAAIATKNEALVTAVTDFRQQMAAAEKPVDQWADCLEGGNASQGRTVFFGRATASCRRCHKVNGNGANVGPNLTEIAKTKDRRYLLESIVDPNAQIAKGFETTVIIDDNGKVHAGIIKQETDQVVKLMSPQGAISSIPVDEIDERAKGLSGMPSDLAKNLSRQEIRDVVEYLSTLKKRQNNAAHGNEE